MKIYITRHSLTAWNEEKRLQGWKDSPLTKQGKEDALKLGEYMKTIHIDQVYSSPLLRAKSTARLIFKNENDLKRKRMELILYFKNEFSCINCCALKKSCAQNGCCNIIIYKTGEMLEKVIENKNL